MGLIYTREEFKHILENHYNYFFQINGEASWSDGWKLSIQGQTIEDAMELYDLLIDLLLASKCSFKFGTQLLIDRKHPQQSTKLLTIYIPNGVDVKSFAELVRLNIKYYEGGDDVLCPESYEHYANAIYYRNDRDQFGRYIPAN